MQMGKSAAVAQLVEQRIRNAWVGGSSPLSGTIFFYLIVIFQYFIKSNISALYIFVCTYACDWVEQGETQTL